MALVNNESSTENNGRVLRGVKKAVDYTYTNGEEEVEENDRELRSRKRQKRK